MSYADNTRVLKRNTTANIICFPTNLNSGWHKTKVKAEDKIYTECFFSDAHPLDYRN